MEDLDLWSWLELCSGRPGRKRRRELLGVALRAGDSLRKLLRGVSLRRESTKPENIAGRHGLRVFPVWHADYPPLLRVSHDPPLSLFVRGDIRCLHRPCLAIVGARSALPYGRMHARRLACEVAAEGITIVSGLARGIDAAAHRGAMDGRGMTAAVLGSGHLRLYPRDHDSLCRDIVEKGGCVLSEFLPTQAARPFHFPMRNRVIAALCEATFIIEAARRSGALITADWAAEEGRAVFALPGPVDSPNSAGVHALIRDGALAVTSSRDILELFGRRSCRTKSCPDATWPREGSLEKAILREIGDGLLPRQELLDRVDRPASESLRALNRLEMRGLIQGFPGRLYCAAPAFEK